MEKTTIPLSRTVCERVTEALREDIVDGVLAPEERLKISMLTERYGVSAAPVREALQQLHTEGLISIIPNRGACVRRISAKEFVHLMDVREAIEGLQARRCAETSTQTLIHELKKANDKFESAAQKVRSKQSSVYNAEFHDLIAKHGGNWIADEIITRVRWITAALRRQYRSSSDRLKKACLEHRQIIEAIEKQDPEGAENAARLHVIATKADILQMLPREYLEPSHMQVH